MRKRWVLGGMTLAIGLLVTAGAWPASAAAPTVNFTSPGDGESVKDGPAIEGNATMPNGGTVNSITVELSSNGRGHDVPPTAFASNHFRWEPDVPWNGVYTAKAKATGTDPFPDLNNPEQGPEANRTFRLEKPPIPPTGLKTSVNDDKRTVTVTWDANPEPDMITYCVYANGKALKGGCALGDKTSYTHELGDLPAGDYEYTVFAVRDDADPDDDNGVASGPTKKTATVRSSPTVALAAGAPPTSAAPRTTAKSSSSASSGSRTPTPSSGGRVNISNLLGDRSELPLAQSGRTASEPDPGFSEELPFAGSPRTSIVSGEAAAQELNGEPVSSSDSRPESLLFLAAGLLVTVILMHVLWLKSEVDRAPLEPLTPDAALKP